MLILPFRQSIESVDDIKSIVKRHRWLSIYEVMEHGKIEYDFMLINIAMEVGGKSEGIVRRLGDYAKTYFLYRGKFLNDPFIDRGALKLDPGARLAIKQTSYSYTGGSESKKAPHFHSNFQDYYTNDRARYPDGTTLWVPKPKFFNETHQILSGDEKSDYDETLYAHFEQHDVYELREFYDSTTQVRFSTMDYDGWGDDADMKDFGCVRTISGLHYEETLAIQSFSAIVQHALYIALIDSATIIVDPDDGYNITRMGSLLVNLKDRGFWKTDGMIYFIQVLEDEYSKMRDYFENKTRCRIFFEFNSTFCQIKIMPKSDITLSNTDRKRAKSDLLLFDLPDNFA
jgi:hypothetical protein